MKKLIMALLVLLLVSASASAETILTLVNRQNSLESDYVPEKMIIPDVEFKEEVFEERKQLLEPAAHALEAMFAAAKEQDITLIAVSGYRSYWTQHAVYEQRLQETSLEYVTRYIAKPGQSEHQTGLAMDLGCPGYVELTESFCTTDAYAWLLEHCGEYGFIIRYRENLVEETGYAFEPWHVRYVGDPAQEIMERGISLEAYLTELESRSRYVRAGIARLKYR